MEWREPESREFRLDPQGRAASEDDGGAVSVLADDFTESNCRRYGSHKEFGESRVAALPRARAKRAARLEAAGHSL